MPSGARTIGTLVAEARTLLQDKVPLPAYRYSDDELMEAFNGAMSEARAKRPDLFLDLGLRTPLPIYTSADFALPFPLDMTVYNAFMYYLVGRSEMRDDTFVDNSRATVFINKFVNQLLQVVS